MERGQEGAERRLDESKMRLQAADERRKAAVLEVCACAAAAPLRGACAAPRARGASRWCGRASGAPVHQWLSAGQGAGGAVPRVLRPRCPVLPADSCTVSGGSAAGRDRGSARRHVRAVAAARRAPAQVCPGTWRGADGGCRDSIVRDADDPVRQAGAERAALCGAPAHPDAAAGCADRDFARRGPGKLASSCAVVGECLASCCFLRMCRTRKPMRCRALP